MDYGRIIICAVLFIYFIIRYAKEKKAFNLAMIFIFAAGTINGGAYSIYKHLDSSIQGYIDIGFGIFALVVLYKCIYEKKKVNS